MLAIPIVIFLLYIFLVFVGIRLIVPFYGFYQAHASKAIPDVLQKEIEHLNKNSLTDEEFLKNIYTYLIHRYYGSRWEIFPKWQYAFKDIAAIESGFLPCNIFNQLLKTILIKSSRFDEEDIKTQVVFLNFFIHQYLKVRVENKWIAVDPTYAKMGVPFGKRAFFFA